nr:AMP-binding protein [Alkalihalobacterium alkalinitrilicum]
MDTNDVAAILYSSGTTSLPKGIVITQGNQVFRAYSFAIEWSLNYNDVILVTVPIYHSMGHLYAFYVSLLGCKLIITRNFQEENTLRLIQDYKVTSAFFVPTQYILMLESPSFHQYDLSSLRLLVSAGAPMTEVTKKRVIENFNCKFTEFYGTTEVSPLAILRPKDVLRKSASVGQRPSFMVVRLLDKKGNEVAIGEEGEFATKGPSIFLEYYKNNEETEKARTPDGFHRTGDMEKLHLNRVCELLEIDVPVIEGGLAYVGNGLLAAAVSNGGGFGQVGSAGRTPENFEEEILLVREATENPFGVNIPIVSIQTIHLIWKSLKA